MRNHCENTAILPPTPPHPPSPLPPSTKAKNNNNYNNNKTPYNSTDTVNAGINYSTQSGAKVVDKKMLSTNKKVYKHYFLV